MGGRTVSGPTSRAAIMVLRHAAIARSSLCMLFLFDFHKIMIHCSAMYVNRLALSEYRLPARHRLWVWGRLGFNGCFRAERFVQNGLAAVCCPVVTPRANTCTLALADYITSDRAFRGPSNMTINPQPRI